MGSLSGLLLGRGRTEQSRGLYDPSFRDDAPVYTLLLSAVADQLQSPYSREKQQGEEEREQINSRGQAPLGMTRGGACGCQGLPRPVSTQVRLLVPGLAWVEQVPRQSPETCFHDTALLLSPSITSAPPDQEFFLFCSRLPPQSSEQCLSQSRCSTIIRSVSK